MSTLKSVSTGTAVSPASKSFVVQNIIAPPAGAFLVDDFENGLGKWDQIGSNVSIINSGGINNSKHLNIHYTGAGTAPYTVIKNMDFDTAELYVKVSFKMSRHSGYVNKFIKFFGNKNAPTGYANCTFSGQFNRVSYGNGSGTINDTQHKIEMNGNHSDPLVNIVKSSSNFSPTLNKLHEYQGYMKYNSNGNRDGVFMIWIDGELRLHATNVKNRHDSNARSFLQARLADYTADSETWDMGYDNVVMSTEFIG